MLLTGITQQGKLYLKKTNKKDKIVNFPKKIILIGEIFLGFHIILASNNEIYFFDFQEEFIKSIIPFENNILSNFLNKRFFISKKFSFYFL